VFCVSMCVYARDVCVYVCVCMVCTLVYVCVHVCGCMCVYLEYVCAPFMCVCGLIVQ
jgi:hypothetical protein